MEGIEEQVKIILEKVKEFLKEHEFHEWENKTRRIFSSMFLQRRIALYSLTGEFPKNENPRIKEAQLLKLLQESEEIQISGYNNNQNTGKIDIPKSMMKQYIELLDEKIWGEKGTWGREYTESQYKNNIDNIIKEEKSITRRKPYSKYSFLGMYCKGWLYELAIRHVFNSNYERLIFIYDLLNAYGINLIENDFNDGNPINKDKEQYIKGMIKSKNTHPLGFSSKWNIEDPSEWVNFL